MAQTGGSTDEPFVGITDRTLAHRLDASIEKKRLSAFDLQVAGRKRVQEEEYRTAVTLFQRSLDTFFDPTALMELADAQRMAGQTDAAIVSYRKLLSDSPDKHWRFAENMPVPRLHLALLLNAAGEWQEALANYNYGLPFATSGTEQYHDLPFAVAFKPDVVETKRFEVAARNALGIALMIHHDNALAQEQFDKALSLHPTNAVSHYYKGQNLAYQGHYAQAAPEFALAEKSGRVDVPKAIATMLKMQCGVGSLFPALLAQARAAQQQQQ